VLSANGTLTDFTYWVTVNNITILSSFRFCYANTS